MIRFSQRRRIQSELKFVENKGSHLSNKRWSRILEVFSISVGDKGVFFWSLFLCKNIKWIKRMAFTQGKASLDAIVFVLIDLDDFTLKYNIISSQGVSANELQ